MNSKIIELRSLLAEKFPAPRPRPHGEFSTGIPWLDASGGLPRGALIELVRPRSGLGGGMILLSVMRHSVEQGRRVALVDGADSFDPEGLSPRERKKVLWVRCNGVNTAIKAMDLLLRDGNLPVVILDLACNSTRDVQRIPLMTWHRMQRVAEESGNVSMIITPSPVVSSATSRFELKTPLPIEGINRLRTELLDVLQAHVIFIRNKGIYATAS